jgi:hypothetical protein
MKLRGRGTLSNKVKCSRVNIPKCKKGILKLVICVALGAIARTMIGRHMMRLWKNKLRSNGEGKEFQIETGPNIKSFTSMQIISSKSSKLISSERKKKNKLSFYFSHQFICLKSKKMLCMRKNTSFKRILWRSIYKAMTTKMRKRWRRIAQFA